MRRPVLCLVAIVVLVLLLPTAAQAKHRIPVPFQTMPFNNVTVTPGGSAEFLYTVECPRSYGEEADCTLVIVDRPGGRVVPVASVYLGVRRVVHFNACGWPASVCVSDTCPIDLKRGYYEWYVSATMTVGGAPRTNTSFAMNPLYVEP
jgi:hypothetical protein